MITEAGHNAPAPWVPYTRAGCTVGAFATGNVVLENTAIDIPTVFGPSSLKRPKWPPTPPRDSPTTWAWRCTAPPATRSARPQTTAGRTSCRMSRVAIAVQCSVRREVRRAGDQRRTDARPGRQRDPGLRRRCPSHRVPGLRRRLRNQHAVLRGPDAGSRHPITYGYITDAHDDHGISGEQHIASGPGQQTYVDQLKRYDDAFAKFFSRLAADGINKSNTLFVFTVEEGDHFVGSQPTPAGCDGVNTACSYAAATEVNGNLRGLLQSQQGITTPFAVHADMAPTVYLSGNPTRTADVTREFERATGRLTALNPLTGATDDLTVAMADPVEMDALHMVSGDPLRTPTFTMFAHPDYFLFTSSASCGCPRRRASRCQGRAS